MSRPASDSSGTPGWSDSWKQPRFRSRALTTFLFLTTTLVLFSQFIRFIESRPGSILSDPVLTLFQPVDLTVPTFVIIYGGILTALVALHSRPAKLLILMQAYSVLTLLRIACLYFLPLDPPATTIPLRDPFVELFGSGGAVLTRDLFFSGHTSMLVLLGFAMHRRDLRRGFFVAAALVGVSVLLQHVHYTIDVVVAPLAADVAFRIVRVFQSDL